MPIVSDNFTQLTDFDPILDEIFHMSYDQVPDMINTLFGVRGSNKAKETDLRVGSFRDPVELEGRIEYQTPQADFEIEYVHTEYASGFMVERKMLDDMQYDGIFDSASQMGTAFARKRQKDAASVFNNAFTAGATAGYDGVALCSDSHPLSESDTTTVDNNLALALTGDNLETAITTMQAFGDDLGEEIVIMPDILLVPRALWREARELTESEKEPESAENAINVFTGLRAVVWPYLTDTNAWFLIDSTMANRYLKWYNRVPVEFGAEEDFDTFFRKYRGYMRYSFGWSDWRWVIGSNPS